MAALPMMTVSPLATKKCPMRRSEVMTASLALSP
jgi:hypothetical protein